MYAPSQRSAPLWWKVGRKKSSKWSGHPYPSPAKAWHQLADSEHYHSLCTVSASSALCQSDRTVIVRERVPLHHHHHSEFPCWRLEVIHLHGFPSWSRGWACLCCQRCSLASVILETGPQYSQRRRQRHHGSTVWKSSFAVACIQSLVYCVARCWPQLGADFEKPLTTHWSLQWVKQLHSRVKSVRSTHT